MCAYSVFNTFPVYPLSAKPLILLAFCRYRYHTSLFLTPVLFWILETYGWREIFYITGFIGIVASLGWFFLYREPGPDSGANQAELDYIRQGGGLGSTAAEKQKIT